MKMIKLVAEIGINHNGDIDIAKRLIDVAAFAGFDYVKFQKRTPDVCVPDSMKNQVRSTPWGDIKYIDYRKRIEFGSDEYEEIDIYCLDRNIGWFASAWDIPAAEFLSYYCDMVKIPSALITDHELLDYCRVNFDTVIMSTGMSTEDEIIAAVNIGDPDVIMHSNATYPTRDEELNLSYIQHLRESWPKKVIGYSGHELGLETTFAVCLYGAEWIERHVTLDRSLWGSDQAASIDPIEMIKLVRGVRRIESAMGEKGPRRIYESEMKKREQLRK